MGYFPSQTSTKRKLMPRFYRINTIKLKRLNIASASSKEFFYIQATTVCSFNVKRVCDMIKTQTIKLI